MYSLTTIPVRVWISPRRRAARRPAPAEEGVDDHVGGRPRRADGQAGEEELHEGADRHREDYGAQADGAAEQPADGQGRELDARAHEADRPDAAGGEPGHEAVPWAGPEAGPDVEPGPGAPEEHAERQVREAADRRPRRVEHQEGQVDRGADQQDVEHRAEAGSLAEGQPRQEDQRPDEDADGADREAGALRDPLVEHRPGGEAEVGGDHEGEPSPHSVSPAIKAGEAPAGLDDRTEDDAEPAQREPCDQPGTRRRGSTIGRRSGTESTSISRIPVSPMPAIRAAFSTDEWPCVDV